MKIIYDYYLIVGSKRFVLDPVAVGTTFSPPLEDAIMARLYNADALRGCVHTSYGELPDKSKGV